MKKVFVIIFLSLFISNTIIAHPISERQQAVKDAELDAKLVRAEHFFIGTGTGFGLCIFTFAAFIYNYYNNTSSTYSCLWPVSPITAGSLLGTSTISTIYLMWTPVPAGKLLGKSPEYVHHYTKSYQNKLRRTRVGSAAFGCAIGCLVSVSILYIYADEL